MILTLEVVGEQARNLGTATRKEFQGIGGTIGRLPDNDWVFPDPYVSGRHALIRYVNGKYFIEDTSTNGVFINSRDNRVQRHQAYPLRDGDFIYIDAYQIKVSIARDPARAAQRDPFASLTARASQPATAPLREDRKASAASERDADDDHETEWFRMTDVSPKLDQPAARASSSGRSPPANGIGQLQRLLEAGATDDIDQPAALVTAMRIAFEATLAHFDPDLLQDEFERHLSKGSILGAPAKLRYWELYQDRYAQMVKQADSTFLQLFAKAFAKAYEEECERQRTVGES